MIHRWGDSGALSLKYYSSQCSSLQQLGQMKKKRKKRSSIILVQSWPETDVAITAAGKSSIFIKLNLLDGDSLDFS